MLGINNNAATVAQNQLNRAHQAADNDRAHLASGKKVDNAADDAAGIALISKFAAEIAGNSASIRNVNDGISLAQTADAGVGQIDDMMQRMRELTIQSQNSTYNDSDRSALQAEAAQLQEQVADTIASTTFNGSQLLDQDEDIVIQAGSESGDTIRLSIGSTREQLDTLGFNSIDLSTPEGAAGALEILDKASDFTNGLRGQLGAIQNRFEATIDGLESSTLNTAKAKSQIEDVDVARTLSEQTSNMIKEQAATAMLGQANLSSQHVMQLLDIGP